MEVRGYGEAMREVDVMVGETGGGGGGERRSKERTIMFDSGDQDTP